MASQTRTVDEPNTKNGKKGTKKQVVESVVNAREDY
jgi:hypothetical protein